MIFRIAACKRGKLAVDEKKNEKTEAVTTAKENRYIFVKSIAGCAPV